MGGRQEGKEAPMARELCDDPLFDTIAGVARDRRHQVGATADLRVDPVFAAACCFVGLDHWRDEPDPEQRMERSRGIIEAMRPANVGDE